MASTQTRRAFLRGTGAALAGAALSSSPALAAASRAPAGAASLPALARRLRGPLLTAHDAAFPAATQLWNPAVQRAPRAVAQCASAQDVAEVLTFAARKGWTVAPRGGRHSFAGYSNAPGGIVADVSALDELVVDRGAGTVRVGAGLTGLDLYRDLIVAQGVAVPIGTCPTVGIAGLALGGGISRLVRRAGVLADSLLGAEVVLTDGRIVTCDAAHEPELLWALRGGGGGNVGVVTSLTFALQPTPDLLAVTLSFDWAQAAGALAAWQASLPDADDRLAYARLRLLRRPDGRLTATVGAHWYGTEADLRAVLAPLLAAGPTSTSITTRTFADAWLPDGTTRQSDGSYVAEVVRRPNYQRSQFVHDDLDAAGIAALLAGVEAWPGGPHAYEGGVQLDCFGPGSAVNRVAPDATAFVHRDQRFHIAYLNFWGAEDTPAVAAANVAWVRALHATMAPRTSGQAYQNYIDPELRGWEQAYYAGNLARLQRAKRRYDPREVLRFAQSVRPTA